MEHPNMEHPNADAVADARTTPPALRALSWLLDAVVVGVAMLVVAEPYPLIVPLGLAVAYLTLIVWWTSTTIGKAALGLRVVRTNGPVTLPWALGRSTLGLIVVDLLGAGLVPALWSAERRALHDRAFHSLVVWTGEPATWRRVSDRLVALADQREQVREEKRRRSRGLVLLTGLWAWMSDLARGVRAHVARWWRDAPPAGTSAGQALTAIVIGKVALGAAAIGAVVGTAVPAAGGVGDVLLRPRCFASMECRASTVSEAAALDQLAAIERWVQEFEGDDDIEVVACDEGRSDPDTWCADLDAAGSLLGDAAPGETLAILSGPFAENVDAAEDPATVVMHPPCRVLRMTDADGSWQVDGSGWCPFD
jgi:hypothetical protein